MKLETAELITQYGGEVRENYSGSGMYGEQTSGVIFDSEKDFYRSLAGIILDCVQDQNMEESALICEALKKLKTDNMGTSIIYY